MIPATGTTAEEALRPLADAYNAGEPLNIAPGEGCAIVIANSAIFQLTCMPLELFEKKQREARWAMANQQSPSLIGKQ